MKLFDTHCHFETTDESEIRAILARACEAGVESLMAVGGSEALNNGAILAHRLAANDSALPKVCLALGYDREQTNLAAGPSSIADRLSSLMDSYSPAAVGEIGLDYHYSPETREQQLALFSVQLEAARTRNLPVVIHTREADDDTLSLLREIPSRGIIHCYTGTPEAARKFLDLGFYISISGIVTFRAAENVRESARVVPDDRLLIETDAPFLAPVPMRGQANEPAFVRHTCDFLARERDMMPDELAELTFANANRCLGVGKEISR